MKTLFLMIILITAGAMQLFFPNSEVIPSAATETPAITEEAAAEEATEEKKEEKEEKSEDE